MHNEYGLAISPGLAMMGPEANDPEQVRRARLTHVLLCIPWTLLKVRPEQKEINLFDQHVDHWASVHAPSFQKTRIMPPAEVAETQGIGTSLGPPGYKRVEEHGVAIVDPEYTVLTTRKIFKINQAIRELRLGVEEIECPTNHLLTDGRQSLGEEYSRLASLRPNAANDKAYNNMNEYLRYGADDDDVRNPNLQAAVPLEEVRIPYLAYSPTPFCTCTNNLLRETATYQKGPVERLSA